MALLDTMSQLFSSHGLTFQRWKKSKKVPLQRGFRWKHNEPETNTWLKDLYAGTALLGWDEGSVGISCDGVGLMTFNTSS
jgi:hypothetical protein